MLSALLFGAARPVQAQTESVLHNFTGDSDGGNPYAGLTPDAAGNFYGTTPFGGLRDDYNGPGIVFKLTPKRTGGWHETVLYSFTWSADGGSPVGPVIFDGAGNLYGTTANGGANLCGVVFELSPPVDRTSWTEKVLYSFACGTDGINPETGLIRDLAGNLYGTTLGCCGYNYGTVFELSPLRSIEVELNWGGKGAKKRIKIVRSDGPKDLVFQSVRSGSTMNDQNIIRRHLRPAAEKLKMDPKKATWRALRTSRATWMCEAGVDPKSVQGAMRHSRISTTMDIYAQFVTEQQRRASARTMDMVNERIERAREALSTAVN